MPRALAGKGRGGDEGQARALCASGCDALRSRRRQRQEVRGVDLSVAHPSPSPPPPPLPPAQPAAGRLPAKKTAARLGVRGARRGRAGAEW